MESASIEDNLWFWGWVIQITIPESSKTSPVGGEVWENLIMVNANTPDMAYEKLMNYGKSLEGNCDGTLALDNTPATVKFLGISDMGRMYEGVGDGAEILFRIRRSNMEEETANIGTKESLLERFREGKDVA